MLVYQRVSETGSSEKSRKSQKILAKKSTFSDAEWRGENRDHTYYRR